MLEQNPEVEEAVRAELLSIDPLLDIKYFPMGAPVRQANGSTRYEPRYALIVRWPQADRRWELYRDGTIGEPFDVLGWFAEDMHFAASAAIDPALFLDEMKRLLARCDNSRESWKVRLAKAAEHNIAQRKRAMAELQEETRARLEDEYYSVGQRRSERHGPVARSFGGLPSEGGD